MDRLQRGLSRRRPSPFSSSHPTENAPRQPLQFNTLKFITLSPFLVNSPIRKEWTASGRTLSKWPPLSRNAGLDVEAERFRNLCYTRREVPDTFLQKKGTIGEISENPNLI